MPQLEFDPNYVFDHHQPNADKLKHYQAVHVGAKAFAEVILQHVPESEDRTTALRLLRESMMMANAAISLDGRWK